MSASGTMNLSTVVEQARKVFPNHIMADENNIIPWHMYFLSVEEHL